VTLPDAPDSAALAETHTAVTVFVADRAYKLKKPVSLGFLDFSTREARQNACHREVEVNRRLAPDVYLGVADVVGPDGQVCDHLVVMRRMPEGRRLSTLVSSGADVDAELRRIARVLASFHSGAGTSSAISRAATRDAVRRNWEDNFEQLVPYVGEVLDAEVCAEVEHLARRYLEGRAPLFTRRIDEGRVRDGHGDLLADDIFCLDDGPRILDCIEFDDRLRHGDVLADVAFLAMDLERLGAPELAERFLAWYRDFSGEAHPASLGEHYVAYRAHVRAKVGCMRHSQGEAQARDVAAQLLDMARRHLRAGRVRLVIVGGLPGTGKSTLAAGLADSSGWVLLRSDEVRKELAGLAYDQQAPSHYREGLYSPERTAEVYSELLERARRALSLGETVVLDASWSDARWRQEAAAAAAETSADLVELACRLPQDEAMARIQGRARAGKDPSDADEEVARAMAGEGEPWPSAIEVDTSGSREQALEAARAALARR
jgi:aminoglycoside phosphotransferase family enzyme/predicted kinase